MNIEQEVQNRNIRWYLESTGWVEVVDNLWKDPLDLFIYETIDAFNIMKKRYNRGESGEIT